MGSRKKCRTCAYRGNRRDNGCDFILITGHSRGCSVEQCKVYKKGPRINAKKRVPWSGEEMSNE